MASDLFFELLQLSLGMRERLSRVPSVHEWNEMYDEAERQAVVGLLLSGLESLPLELLPPLELKLQWIGEVQMMEAEYRMHCERAAELTKRFRSVGFKSCVLKGVGMAQLCPHPERRQCGDIDLWVDRRRKDVMAYLRSEYEVNHVTWHHIGTDVFEDVSVEVHVHPSWLYNPIYNTKLQAFFERNKNSQMVVDERLGFAYTTARFNAIYSLVHTFNHLLEEGIGLRHIVDYYYVLKSLPLTAYEDVLRVLRSIGLGKFTAAMMWMMKEVCGAADELLLCEPDEKEGRFLLSEVMAGGNFGFYRCENMRRNTARRYFAMLPHYPRMMIWMLPWKVWHRVWMMINR